MPVKKLFTQSMTVLIFCSVLFLTPDTYGQQLVNDFIGKIHYRSIGPTRQGGRIVDFAVPLQQNHTFYAAAANGGLWKTVNNGTTFFPIFDYQNVFAIGDIAVDQNNPNTVWVGTGEANFSTTDPYATYWGDGIYKSTDGGETWRNMGLGDTHQIGRIIVHQQNSDIVYVAALGHLYTESEERGVFKTTNGGRTWEKSLGVVLDGRHISVVDLVMDPSNPDILYASSYDRIAKPWMFYEGGPGSGIYKTTNGGDSWTKLTGGLPDERVGRIGLTISPQNPGLLYAYVMEDRDSDGQYENRIYRTVNGGARWEQRSPEPISGRSYFGQIRIDPEDDNHVYSLSFGVMHSFDGGRTWSLAFENGGDHHALWIDPRDSKHILSGFDYGLSITYDGGKNWYHPDEMPLAQLYEIGVDMAYPYNVYGGTQDFGTFKGPSTKKGRFPIRFEDWEHMLGGDGYYSKVDPVTNRWLYAESQNGSLSKVDMETGVRKNITYRGNPDIRMNFSAPILISPHNSNVIYHGANMVLRSSFRGENWEEISPDLTTDNPELRNVGQLAYCTITTLDESPVQQGVIWAGTDDGNVQLTSDGGETWTKLNDRITGNPGYWVSRVTASHYDAGAAYVTYTGRRQDDFRPFVYKTTDFGQTWESIANNLPNDEPVNVIREDRKNPDLLFIGTEKTVHVSLDGGENWTRMQNNLPTTGVQDLVIHPRENDLVVGSHGRGFFIADISVLQELTPGVLAKDVHLFDIGPKVQWVMTSQKSVSAQNYSGENEPHGAVINYYLKEPARTTVTISIYDGSRLIHEITDSGRAGLNSVEWYMTKRKRRRTREEIAQYDRRVADSGINYWFDYYDTVDFFGEADEEVDRYGRSLRTRVAREADARGREYVFARVRPGTFTVKLSVDGGEYTGQAVVLKDYWYDK